MSKYSKIAHRDKEVLIKQFGSTYEYIPDSSKVLDVGCSSGYYGELLKKEKKCIVWGIDVNKNDLSEAKKKLDKVFLLNLENGHWPEILTKERFDVIFFGDVIEHLIDPKNILKKFKKLLKPNGVMIISVPNIAHLSIRLELLLGNFEYEKIGILDETHTKYFTLKSLKRLVNSLGCNIIDIDYYSVYISKSIVDKWLKKAGLVADKKFYDKFVNQPSSIAYQYKLVIQPNDKISKKVIDLPVKPLNDKFEYDNIAKQKEEEIKEIKKYVKALEGVVESLKNSTSWKLTKPLRSAKKIISRKK